MVLIRVSCTFSGGVEGALGLSSTAAGPVVVLARHHEGVVGHG